MGIYIDKQYIASKIVDKLINDKEKQQQLTENIYQLELESKLLFNYSTYKSHIFRNFKYEKNNDRNTIRRKILKELISFDIPINEDNICLGSGGCAPAFVTKHNFFQIIGLPGSGKTYMANIISKKYGAYLVDSDFAKRKFPEFESFSCSSSLLHEEANELTYSLEINSLFKYCIQNEFSMVVPRIGYLYESLSNTLKLVKNNGYNVYLILMDMDSTESIKNCYKRYSKTGRYIPLLKILNDCGSLPKENYDLIKNDNYISGYALIATNLFPNYSVIEKFCSD